MLKHNPSFIHSPQKGDDGEDVFQIPFPLQPSAELGSSADINSL